MRRDPRSRDVGHDLGYIVEDNPLVQLKAGDMTCRPPTSEGLRVNPKALRQRLCLGVLGHILDRFAVISGHKLVQLTPYSKKARNGCLFRAGELETALPRSAGGCLAGRAHLVR